MSVAEILRTVGDQFQSGANVKHVYGEPISKGDRTVIPVARVFYAFGGGGGTREGERAPEGGGSGGGGGGGGRMSAAPAGVIEITPTSTHFIPFTDWRKWLSVVALSLAVGFMIGARRPRS